MKNMIVAKSHRFSTSTKLEIGEDRRLQQRANFTGIPKSSYIREIINAHLSSVEQGKPGTPAANSTMAMASHFYSDVRESLADGEISPVENNHLTDHLADLLSQLRGRRSA